MPHARCDASPLYLGDDEFIVIGGAMCGQPINFVEMLHRKGGAWTWRTLASMIHKRSEAAVAPLHGGSHILAIGGRDEEEEEEVKTSEMFRFPQNDDDMGQWSLVNLPITYDVHSSLFDINAGLYKFSNFFVAYNSNEFWELVYFLHLCPSFRWQTSI